MGDPSKVGVNAEFDAIAVVGAFGGRANVLGPVVGALIMQVISTSFNMLLIPFTWSLVLKSVIILFAVFCSVRRSNASWLHNVCACGHAAQEPSREAPSLRGPAAPAL